MASRRSRGAKHAKAPEDAAPQVSDYLSSREAAQLLGIKLETLYAYVSRGLIQSVEKGAGSSHLYRREDVEYLRSRGHARAEGSLFKAGTPRWSEPIVHTAITRITPNGPAYRGRLALELEQEGSGFESVADLLWSGALTDQRTIWSPPRRATEMDRLLEGAAFDADNPDVNKIFTIVVAAMAGGEYGDDLRNGTTIPAARALLAELPRCLGYLTSDRRAAESESGPIAASILRAAKAAATPGACKAIDSALVLLADHELTPQTFAARLAASNRASMHFCLLAALSVHSNSRIRRACDRIEDILMAASGPRDFHDRIEEMARSMRSIPGFNHPLYPKGDPRAKRLVEIAHDLSMRNDGIFPHGALLDEMLRREKATPSVEVALVILCQVLRLPYRSAAAILTIARCAGWVAHLIEQRLAGIMLRPRARYSA